MSEMRLPLLSGAMLDLSWSLNAASLDIDDEIGLVRQYLGWLALQRNRRYNGFLRLPIELLENIISDLSPATVRDCALVCSSLFALVRPRLAPSVYLGYIGSVAHALRLVRLAPHLAEHIHDLSMCDLLKDSKDMGTLTDAYWYRGPELPLELPEIHLSGAQIQYVSCSVPVWQLCDEVLLKVHTRALKIRSTHYETWPRDSLLTSVSGALVYPALARLRNLTLDRCEFKEVGAFESLLGLFPALAHLKLGSCQFTCDAANVEPARVVLPLESLTLLPSGSEGRTLDLLMLRVAPLSISGSLRSLRCDLPRMEDGRTRMVAGQAFVGWGRSVTEIQLEWEWDKDPSISPEHNNSRHGIGALRRYIEFQDLLIDHVPHLVNLALKARSYGWRDLQPVIKLLDHTRLPHVKVLSLALDQSSSIQLVVDDVVHIAHALTQSLPALKCFTLETEMEFPYARLVSLGGFVVTLVERGWCTAQSSFTRHTAGDAQHMKFDDYTLPCEGTDTWNWSVRVEKKEDPKKRKASDIYNTAECDEPIALHFGRGTCICGRIAVI